MLKKLFGKKDPTEDPKNLTIEDFIVLERWDEAIAGLEARLKTNENDLHAHLKLAEVFAAAGKPQRAIERYVHVAASYTDDGFYDKATALLTKVARLSPGDKQIADEIRRAQQSKDLEHRRSLALEGLRSSQEKRSEETRLSLLQAQRLWEGLASTEVVLKLPGEQLKRLFEHSFLHETEKDEILAERGAKDEMLFLVASGEVEAVLDSGDGRPTLLRTMTRGDVFGDRSLLEHEPWPATYRVLTSGRLFRLEKSGLEEALTGNPDPRLFLDALRSRRHDHDVAASARKILSSAR